MSSASQRYSLYSAARPAIGRFAVALFVVCATVGLSIGFVNIFDDARAQAAAEKSNVTKLAADWQAKITTRFTQANSLAITIGSFAAGNATVAPNHSATAKQRIQFISNASWNRLAASLFDEIPGILSLQLQPSGVIAQAWPLGSAPIGADVLNNPLHTDAIWRMVDSKRSAVFGPLTLIQGGYGFLARFPIYVDDNKTRQSWWGHGAVVARIVDLFSAMSIRQSFAGVNCDYLFDFTNTSNATIAVGSSLPLNESAVVRKEGVSVTLEQVDPLYQMFFHVRPVKGFRTAVPLWPLIVAVVLGTIGGSLAAVVLYHVVLLVGLAVGHRAVPHTSETAPIDTATCLISLRRVDQLLEEDPEMRPILVDEMHSFLRDFVAEHDGCYLSHRLGDSCYVAVASRPHDVVRLAAAVKEKLLYRYMERARKGIDKINGEGATARSPPPLPAKGGGTARDHPTQRSNRTKPPADSEGSESDRSASDHNSRRTGYSGTNRPSAVGLVQCAMALHYGPTTSQYVVSENRYVFSGEAIKITALAVDRTLARETSWTEAFATVSDLLPRPSGNGKEIQSRRCVSDEEDDHDDAARHSLSHQGGPSGGRYIFVVGPKKLSKSSKKLVEGTAAAASGSGCDDGFDDNHTASAAAAWSAATGDMFRRRGAILTLQFRSPMGTAVSATDPALHPHGAQQPSSNSLHMTVEEFPKYLATTQRFAESHKATILSVRNYTVQIGFNVVNPMTNASQRAAFFAVDLRTRLDDEHRQGVSVVAGITYGMVHCGAVGGAVVCCGGALDASLNLVTMSPPELVDEKRCSVFATGDALTEIASAFEMQSVMISNGRVVQRIEAPWPTDTEEEWLYVLQVRMEKSPFYKLNAAFAALEKEDAEGFAAAWADFRAATSTGVGDGSDNAPLTAAMTSTVSKFALERLIAASGELPSIPVSVT